MSSTARMDRARLEQFNRFWEELLQAVPDARRQAVEEAGAAVQRELNAQIGAAELADGAKHRAHLAGVAGGQQGRLCGPLLKRDGPAQGGGNAAYLEGKARVQKAGHPLAGAGARHPQAGGRKQPVVEPGGAGRSHAGLSRRICQGPAIL